MAASRASCGVSSDNGEETDPVTTVLRKGTADEIRTHLDNHAGLDHDAGSNQRFRDNSGCVEGEISMASAGGAQACWKGICATDRWHIRCNILSTPDPAGGGKNWASCTPHRDTNNGAVYDGCGHVVEDFIEVDGFSGSGFDVGKDWLWWELVHDDGHYFEGAQYWDNRLRMRQCNGDLSGSNGWVNVIWITGRP